MPLSVAMGMLQTADYALIVSICSAALALFSLGWNIWSKFIFPKPRFVVALNVMQMVDGSAGPKALRLMVTNHGPFANTVESAVCRAKSVKLGFRLEWGLLNPLSHPFFGETTTGPFTGLPVEVGVGKAHSLYFSYEESCVLTRGIVRVGVSDGFGRKHWAPRRDIRKAIESSQRDHPEMWQTTRPVGA